MPDLETTVREHVARLAGLTPAAIDPSARLDSGLGLTSMKMVLLITGLCQRLGVPLTSLTEIDLAEMTTTAAVIARLDREYFPQEN
jgi:acyl carrier protein